MRLFVSQDLVTLTCADCGWTEKLPVDMKQGMPIDYYLALLEAAQKRHQCEQAECEAREL